MVPDPFTVALGPDRYVVERPWGRLPAGAGKVTDVATDSAGRVYVLARRDHYVDPPGDCVHVLSPAGDHLASWGGARVRDAHMIACDGRDRLWVVDRDAHEIVGFDADGAQVGALGRRDHPLEPFNHPSDIAFGPDGTVFVADGYGAGRVHAFEGARLARGWGEVGVAPGQFMTAHGVWATPEGLVLVADRENNRVQVFGPDGTPRAIWTGFHRPSDIWGDARGRVFVTDGVPTLTMLDASGARLGRCRPVLNGAHGLWGDGRGVLYLAEGTPSRITRLVPKNLYGA